MKLFEVTITTWENLQIATHKSVSFTPHIVLISAFSGCVCHLEQLHAQSPFLFPIVFSINLIPFFNFAQLTTQCCSFTPVVRVCAALLGPLRGRNSCCLWFWQLVFGVSLRAATSNLPSPQPPLKQQCAPRWEKARLFTIQRPPRISTSYKFTAPRYRLPCRLFRWASNLAFQRHWKIAQSCGSHKD